MSDSRYCKLFPIDLRARIKLGSLNFEDMMGLSKRNVKLAFGKENTENLMKSLFLEVCES